ncbi:hypothetical protein ACOY7H_06515, partial [Enterobacter roggenkampii]
SERIPAAAGIVNLRYKSCPEMAGQDQSDDLRDAAAGIFRSHKVTENLMRKAASIPVGKLNINLEYGTIENAFSESELNMVYADFYMKNSISGNA